MSKETIISEQDLKKLTNNGSVYICRSCKDNLNKLVLLSYKAGGTHQVFTGFCASCTTAMQACNTCQK